MYNRGVFVSVPQAFRNSCLHLAAWHGHAAITEALLAAGSSVTVRDTDDKTPLHVAALWGHLAIVQLLCDHGSQLDALNKARPRLAPALREAAQQNSVRCPRRPPRELQRK